MKKVSIRKEAKGDIADAYTWYEEKREGLGANFILCVEEAVARISRNPQIYPTVYQSIRRAFVKRFPFGIFYLETETNIVVLAVMHARKSPKTWKGRT